ncbi:hypothetical protein DSECCO2_545380 [anaerobic digester metagenome]
MKVRSFQVPFSATSFTITTTVLVFMSSEKVMVIGLPISASEPCGECAITSGGVMSAGTSNPEMLVNGNGSWNPPDML